MSKISEKLRANLRWVVLAGLVLLAGAVFYLLQGTTKQADSSQIPLVSEKAFNLTESSQKTGADKKESSGADSASAGASEGSSLVMVDLKGAVVKPAVYQLAADARVEDLVKLAGGFTKEADQKSVNLAAKVKDEEVVYVASLGEGAPAVASGAAAASTTASSNLTDSSGGAKVNLNTADLAALQTLSGIGAKKAQDIIDYRTQNGPFKSVDDLGNVSGFGDKTLAKIRDAVTVN